MAFFDPVPEEQLSPESKPVWVGTLHRRHAHEMIGIASFWNLATTFGTAMDAGLRGE